MAGGTLLLDEIGELPPAMQAKLLRVLQEGTVEPLGATQAVAVDFRLVAATNRDLLADVATGRFRADLYYRLLVCPLELPPLRDRPGDVAPLARSFLGALGESRELEPRALELLTAWRWPGNVRELQNLVERLSVCARGPTLRAEDLPADLRQLAPVTAAPAAAPAAPAPAAPAAPSLPVDLPAMLRDLEESYIAAALEHAGGNKTLAADLLGLGRTTLVEKLRRRAKDGAAVE
jgi:sigma-54 specific flagellar transcriptional regulator A